MVSKQEVIGMINQLSDEQLEKVFDYIRSIFSQKREKDVVEFNEEQRELLELLNYTVDTGRGDFAKRHDHYLYSYELYEKIKAEAQRCKDAEKGFIKNEEDGVKIFRQGFLGF